MKLRKKLLVIMLTCMMFFITPISIMAECQEASATEEYVVTESIEDSSEATSDNSFEETEVLNNVSEEVVSEEAISEEEVISEETVSEEEDIPGEEDTSEEVLLEDIVATEEVVSEESNSQEVIEDESKSLVENTTEELVPSPQNETDMAMVTGPTDVVMVQMLYIPSGTLVSSQDATVTASYSMFKVAEAAKVNTYSDGSMTAVITYTGSSFLKMYMGTAADAATATEGFIEAQYVAEKEYTYEVPLTALDTAINAAVLSSKGSWKDNTITVSVAKAEEPEVPTLVSTQDATVTASYSMFKVAEAAKVNTYSDGSMTAVITYTGSSFLKMYMGTAADAATATEGFIEAQYVAEKEYTYEMPLTALDTAVNAAVLSSKGSWKDNTLIVSLVKIEEPEPTPEPTPTPEVPVDGSYTAIVETGGAMFKVVDAKLTVKDGQMTAVITLSGTGYDYLYMGSAADAANAADAEKIPFAVDENGKYTYEIPVAALDTDIPIASHSSKNDTWYDRTLNFKSESLEKYVYIPADGTYSATAETGAAMFKVVNCVVTVKDGKMTALITLSGTGYDYLYMGSAADAANATDADKIPFVVDGNGKYTYEIPVSALDEPLAVASHSSKNDKWFDRTITIDSASLESISVDEQPVITPTPEPTPTPTPDAGVTDDEELEDMIENTKPGEVKDGTYKPSFGYKGGTGRVSLSCSKVVVKDGKATATIVFSSPNFTYMKVNGTKYYNQNKGGNSTFVVPVKLNGTTSVAAETTAMSTPYEIDYTLYVYVDGTNVSGIKPPAPPASEEDETDEEKTEEELAEELVLEEAEEENGWGAFDSVQIEESAELDDMAEDDAVDTLAVTDSGSDTGSLMIPIIISGVAVLAIGAVIVRAYLTSKRKK